MPTVPLAMFVPAWMLAGLGSQGSMSYRLVIMGGVSAAAITMMRTTESVPQAFEAIIVVNQVSATVGVPVMAPVVVSRVSPGGRRMAP